MLGHILYILVFSSVAVAVPAHRLADNASLVLTIGTLGMWRYGWGAINYVRATIFIHIVHPRRRAAVTSRYLERQRPAHSSSWSRPTRSTLLSRLGSIAPCSMLLLRQEEVQRLLPQSSILLMKGSFDESIH